jgi:DNA-binding IclR family transcriptional regulator
MATNNTDNPGTVRSVVRALRLLTTLSSDGLSLTAAAEKAHIPLPTALRLMRTLEGEGFTVRLDDGNFVLGPVAVRLAYEADPEGPLRWSVRETVLRLRDRINETTTCFVRRGNDGLCLESAESHRPIRWVCPRGSRLPLHMSAPGKVLLAYGATDDLLQRLSLTAGTFECSSGRVRRLEDLRSELAEIRGGAIAFDDQESSNDSWGFALPLLVRGVCLGAFGVGMPLERSRSNRDDVVSVSSQIIEEFTSALVLSPSTFNRHDNE